MARKYKGLMTQTASKLFALRNGRLKETQDQRDEMAYTLRLSDQPRMKELSRRCFDPIYKGVSFAKLTETLGMDWRDIAREYKQLKKSQGEVAAARYIPVLMEQTAQECLSRDIPCQVCSGSGKVASAAVPADELEEDETGTAAAPPPDPVPCEKCDGTGTVHVKGDIDRLRLMFDTYGLSGKGPAFIQNLDLRTVAPGEKLGDLAKSVSGIVEGSARVRDEDEGGGPTQ